MAKKKAPAVKKRGPKAQSLRIDGDWKDAVRSAMQRGRPPQPDNKKRRST